MIKVLITGADSYIDESVCKCILFISSEFNIDSVDIMGKNARKYAEENFYIDDVTQKYLAINNEFS